MRTGHSRDSSIGSMLDRDLAGRMAFPVDELGLTNLIASLRSPHCNVCTLASGVIWSLVCIDDVWNPDHAFAIQDLVQALFDLAHRCLRKGRKWIGPGVTLRCVRDCCMGMSVPLCSTMYKTTGRLRVRGLEPRARGVRDANVRHMRRETTRVNQIVFAFAYLIIVRP